MDEWIPPGTVMAPVLTARPRPAAAAAAAAPAVRGRLATAPIDNFTVNAVMSQAEFARGRSDD